MTTPAELARVLERVDRETILLGGDVLVAPFCGRVLAAGPGGGDSAIWSSPALNEPASAALLLVKEGWMNPGGDRVWISPEIDTHVVDATRPMETYEVPAAVDPGAYEVVSREDDRVTMRNAAAVVFHRSGAEVSLQWELTVERLAQAPFDVPAGVIATGYRTMTAFRCSSPPPPGVQPSVWRLLQVPGGGRITVPTKGRVEPRALVGGPAVDVEASALTCDVETAASYKFAIHARDSTGALLYRRDHAVGVDLIVRRFNGDADAIYSDVPFTDQEVRGYVVQVYVDDGGFGGFGELEHHSPALDEASGTSEVIDECDTWAFRGSAEAIDQVQRAAREA